MTTLEGSTRDGSAQRFRVSPDRPQARLDLELRETTYDGITYVCPTPYQMDRFTFLLAKQILDSGQSFDRMVVLGRGGYSWSRQLADLLTIPEMSPIRIKAYTGTNTAEKPRIVQPLTDSVVGERVLIFDEVVDSGVTLALAKPYVEIMGAEAVTTAAECYKGSEVKPDFHAFETKAWVVFQHENREFIEESVARWRPAGLDDGAILERLMKIGLPREDIELFLGRM